ncbi:hypothetical protein H6B51_17435, partial [Pseudoflavonifractor phocaeensis]|nr:hypothetical protein [Pseudoflavonifractor phocaeensis]
MIFGLWAESWFFRLMPPAFHRSALTGDVDFDMMWCIIKSGAVARSVMICHHCGQRYIEFFPNAKQENLFIGMIHAFQYMGMP